MIELWKEIDGYDYKYSVSNFGRFKVVTSFNKSRVGVVSTGIYDAYGYKRVNMTKGGKCVTKKLHRLVAEYFIDGYTDDITINHIDFNKENNHVSNLELMTFAENTLHYIINKRKTSSSSKYIGITFHKQLKKWTCRVTVEGKRYSIGTFNSEDQAIKARKDFEEGKETMLLIGKGVSLIGRSKYNKEQIKEALDLANKIGIRKAGKISGMGSTKISILRKQLKENKA